MADRRIFKYVLVTSIVFFSASLNGLTITVNEPNDTHLSTDGIYDSPTQIDLRGALNFIMTDTIGANNPYVVQFALPTGQETINLGGMLPVLSMLSTLPARTITVDGANTIGSGIAITIDGGNTFRGFVCRQGTDNFQNLTLQNMKAKGGDGGTTGGGGGLGAGAAILVDQASVVLDNVVISNCSATGGNGAPIDITRTGGGGGGMGGNGGIGGVKVSSSFGGPGGGGGLGGSGGDGGDGTGAGTSGGGGGGGGVNGQGGRGGTAFGGLGEFAGGGGGGGVGLGGTGSNGGAGGDSGAGMNAGGNGGSSGQFDMPPTTFVGGGGGGGAGSNLGVPGMGGNGGAGGGAGSAAGGGGGAGNGGAAGALGVGGAGGDGGGSGGSLTASAAAKGAGGDGGGGGGGAGGNGGNGGTGGAGGWGGGSAMRADGGFGAGVSGESGTVSLPGFGGGGGGAIGNYNAVGGGTTQATRGGFGAGGGGNRSAAGLTTGGVGGGQGSRGDAVGGGGGGGGLGGAILVNEGGSLSITSVGSFSNNAVNAGSGAGGVATAGAAAVTDIFFVTGGSSPTFILNSTTLITIPEIGDDGVNTLPGPGYTSGTGNGVNLSLIGPGSVVLSGTNPYGGITTVSTGSLLVNGSITNPDSAMTVAAGSLLGGTGSINGTVQVSGDLTPGNNGNIGILTINDLTLNLGSTFNVALNPVTSAEVVTFASTINGATLNVIAAPGSYTTNVWTILTASPGGLTVNAPFIFTSPAGIPLQIIYNANSIQLFLQFTRLIPTDDLDDNDLKTARYLNSLSGIPVYETIVNTLSGLKFSTMKKALESISPSRNSFTTFASQNTMFLFSRAVAYRLATQRLMHEMKEKGSSAFVSYTDSLLGNTEGLLAQNKGNPMLKKKSFSSSSKPSLAVTEEMLAQNMINSMTQKKPAPSPTPSPAGSATTMAVKNDKHAVWFTGIGEFAHQDHQHQNPSFNIVTSGELLGYDYYGFDRGILGGGVGFAQTSLHDAHHTGWGRTSLYTASIFGTGYIGKSGYIETSFWATYNRFHNQRHVAYPGVNAILPGFNQKAKSSHNGYQLVPHVSGGYDFTWESGVFTGVLEPFAALDYVFNSEGNFSEHGAPLLNVHQKHRTSSVLRSEIGLNAYESWNKDWGVLILRETVSYINKAFFGTGRIRASFVGEPGAFTVGSFTTNQNLFSPAIELFVRLKNGAFLTATYEGEYGSGYISNEVLGEIGVFF